jgi:hypothetical protein
MWTWESHSPLLGGQYGTIKSDLEGLGFVSEERRMVRRREDVALYIDFLTEDPNRNGFGLVWKRIFRYYFS